MGCCGFLSVCLGICEDNSCTLMENQTSELRLLWRGGFGSIPSSLFAIKTSRLNNWIIETWYFCPSKNTKDHTKDFFFFVVSKQMLSSAQMWTRHLTSSLAQVVLLVTAMTLSHIAKCAQQALRQWRKGVGSARFTIMLVEDTMTQGKEANWFERNHLFLSKAKHRLIAPRDATSLFSFLL